jgi:hypothetical protein
MLDVDIRPQHDRRLGRQKVHDSRSRAFPARMTIDRSTWRDKAVRVYDPLPNPNQCHGECTGVGKMIQFNSVGNRKTGVVLGMQDAHRNYSRNTELDPWEGSWPPDDTGSSGLASCKSAVEHGLGGAYEWYFGGADEVIQGVHFGRVISVGTWWYWDMFNGYTTYAGLPVIRPTGGEAGGHQYVIRGYDKGQDLALGRCWWDGFRDFWIARTGLDALLRDGGDAHWQERL